ncbi:MAG: hypothetical protein MJE12_23740 [Alphaproteobacteria bacterium]|nr:hypothetical protein [Alphaproteobacteria bacterium]
MVIDTHPAAAPIDSRLKKTALVLGRVWRIVFGVFLCQAPVTAVLALGWSYRFLRREAFRCWFRQARAGAHGADFATFVADDPKLASVAQWPNWIIGQNYKPMPPAKLERMRRIAWHAGVLFERASGSLWSNLRNGVKALLTLWIVTLPAGLLWLVAWWSGWNNSFNKGYEQAWVGPVLGVTAILMFSAVMFFVPMAQARQAVTGGWRDFFELRLVVRLIAQRPGRYLGLAAVIAVLSMPVIFLQALPLAFPGWIDGYADPSRAQAMQAADGFYVFAAAYVLLAVVGIRMIAARVYALALLDCLNAGNIPIAKLGAVERIALSRFNLLPVTTGRWTNGAGTGARRWTAQVWRWALLALVPLVWIVFAASLFVTQFLHYDWVTWINQPLIHLPWLHRP